MQILNPLRDAQQAQVTGYCPRCGGELYGDWEDEQLCESCKAELEDIWQRGAWCAGGCTRGKERQWS